MTTDTALSNKDALPKTLTIQVEAPEGAGTSAVNLPVYSLLDDPEQLALLKAFDDDPEQTESPPSQNGVSNGSPPAQS